MNFYLVTCSFQHLGMDAHSALVVHVWHLRWSKPLVDIRRRNNSGDNLITVLQRTNNRVCNSDCLDEIEELVVLPRFPTMTTNSKTTNSKTTNSTCNKPTGSKKKKKNVHEGSDNSSTSPCKAVVEAAVEAADKMIYNITATPLIKDPVLNKANEVAEIMATLHLKHFGCNACIFLLHGPPGCGKSTAVRMLTHKLDAKLYSEYNPVRVGESMRSLLSNHMYLMDGTQRLVIGFEEFDVSLESIFAGKMKSTDEYILDAFDKQSWNTLWDTYRYRKYTVVVMTTNKSVAECRQLVHLHDASGSMLRAGRIDGHFVWENGKVKFVEPFKAV